MLIIDGSHTKLANLFYGNCKLLLQFFRVYERDVDIDYKYRSVISETYTIGELQI